jgi:cell division protein FtsI (penicillin-binding protein 3)
LKKGIEIVIRKRILLVAFLVAIGFFIVTLRVFLIMIVQHNQYMKRAERQHQKTIHIEPLRGTIYDRIGRELAVSVELESLYGVPSEIEDPDFVAAKLSTILGMSHHSIEKRLGSDKNFIWLDRKLDPERVRKIKALSISTREIGFRKEGKRFYPKKNLASHLLGFVGMDNKGLGGLELAYEEDMKGEEGLLILGRDAMGREIYPSNNSYKPPSPGRNLYLTIDEVVQYITEKELDRGMVKWKAKGAIAIVMNPKTGEILAMGVRPEFNPNIIGNYKDSDRTNKAVTDSYEPGSTFKVISAAAALEEGVARPGDLFDCSRGEIEVGGKVMRDVHRHGVLSFSEVIQKSSNIGAIQVGMKLGKERFYRYIKDFGFGVKTGIGLPGESSGKVREPKNWSGTSIGAVSIGQEIAVTPLQMLTAFSAIANNGYLMRPYVVSGVRDNEGRVIKSFTPQVARKVISENTSKRLTEILKTVVEEGGTATKAAIQGNLVAGKTGTAQKTDPETGSYSNERYVSSFVGYLPAEDPKISIIVVVDEPKGAIYGGSVAAPIFKEIAEQVLTYLKIPMMEEDRTVFLSNVQ